MRWHDWVIYGVGRVLLAGIGCLPLMGVARIGRFLGWVVYPLDRRHRRVTLDNLARCFPDWPEGKRGDLAREVFKRLGESYACALRTAMMSDAEVREVLEMVGLENYLLDPVTGAPTSAVVAIGHFGNFELYARLGAFMKGLTGATTYRGLPQRGLNRLMQELRERSGCLYFERRAGAIALKAAMDRGGTVLGLLVDQHAGDRGLRLPFLGHEASVNVAPAVFALRYGCPLLTSICYRTSMGRWRIEVGPRIATVDERGHPRPVEAITGDVNRILEAGILKDPANWFWVHRRWKPRPKARRLGAGS